MRLLEIIVSVAFGFAIMYVLQSPGPMVTQPKSPTVVPLAQADRGQQSGQGQPHMGGGMGYPQQYR